MPVVPPLQTDSYPDYDALCDYLQRVAEAVPHLVSLYSLGESPEGRVLLLAEVTNQGTGPASSKPALWLDGNSRGGELAGSMACLSVLHRLAAGHGREELVTSLLDTRAFYLLPRMAPDAAEHALATGEVLQAGRRPGVVEGSRVGLVPADVDGDGRILQMRIEDPRGEWKASRRDPRLLLRRTPDDRQGPFYRLYREGFLEGATEGPVLALAGFPDRDLTRNFPGGGPAPLSEPESRAVADFLRSRPNVGAGLSFRSSEGRLALPAAAGADRELLRHFGQRAREITGYPLEAEPRPGDLVDWMYEELGLVALRSSLWSLLRMAGQETAGDEPSETEMLSLLRWLDRERGGDGFHAWSLHQHPQLGPVEIGGWDLLTTWLNPPPGELLAEECRRNTELALGLAASLPRLVSVGCREQQVGWADAEEGADEELSMPVPLRKVVLEVANDGYLPTWITARGRDRVTPVRVDLLLPEGVQLLLGRSQTDLEPLAGTGSVHTQPGSQAPWFAGGPEEQRRVQEWLVRGDGEIALRVSHPRAGTFEVRTVGEEAPAAPAPPPSAYPVRPPAAAAARTPVSAAPRPPARPAAAPQAPPAAPARPAAPAPPPRQPAPLPRAAAPPARPPAAEPPLAPPPPPSTPPAREAPGYRPAARLPRAPGEAAPPSMEEPAARTAFRVAPPPAAAARGLGVGAAPPPSGEPLVTPLREDSPLRKETPGRVLGDTGTGRVLGAPPARPGTPPGRPGVPPSPARPAEEDLAPLVTPAVDEGRGVARPRPLTGAPPPRVPGGPAEAAPSAPPPVDEDLEAPPSASRIPAPLLLRRPRQPERKEP